MSALSSTSAAGTEPKVRVAILFQRFGPYHHARLNAAGQVLAVWGVEACATEDIYAWDKVEGAGTFTRVTLTERSTGGREWKNELQRKMWQALDDIKPQAVVVPGWSSSDAFAALAWCVKTRTPAIVMSESTAWDEPRTTWKEWVKRRLVKICAAGLAGGTPHADYLAQLGMSRKQIFLGYDIVDNRFFAEKTAEVKGRKSEDRSGKIEAGNLESTKQKAGGGDLPSPISHLPSAPFFLASARFIEKKNLNRLLQAYAQYRNWVVKSEIGNRKSEMWDLVLLGDGPLKADLSHLISELRLENCVHLPGFKQYGELPAYFGNASVFVHASTTEQWGLVVNEAMASGLPVLVSNRCGCAADLVSEGVNGFTFDPTNVEELAQLMVKISAFNFPLSDFGSASSRIIANWGPERFAQGLHSAVTVALKNPHPPANWLDHLLLNLLLHR